MCCVWLCLFAGGVFARVCVGQRSCVCVCYCVLLCLWRFGCGRVVCWRVPVCVVVCCLWLCLVVCDSVFGCVMIVVCRVRGGCWCVGGGGYAVVS